MRSLELPLVVTSDGTVAKRSEEARRKRLHVNGRHLIEISAAKQAAASRHILVSEHQFRLTRSRGRLLMMNRVFPVAGTGSSSTHWIRTLSSGQFACKR